jgi:hypothetical protein
MRPKSHPKKLSIYISLGNDSIHKYYNQNDPAPLAYRQLSYEFQEYLDSSVATAGRRTVVNYKVFCHSSAMSFLSDSLLKSIRRHYQLKRKLAEARFMRFKKKNYILLLISFAVVMFCQGLLPEIINQQHRIHSTLSNALDVFSWVILWKPIERLIFYWNPFLKEILLFKKMESAHMILIDNEEELINYHMEHIDAA